MVELAEMVDAADCGSVTLRVQVPHSTPNPFVAKLANAAGSNPVDDKSCEFKSHQRDQKSGYGLVW